MTYAFTFDATFCSGCKACQAACKDKNNLPLGVLWRRVIEVAGGTWQQNGEAWTNTVFAYNLSISCNHCVHPKCAGICPAGAYEVREDGIVLLDAARCMGCGYCAWGCPYGAPQYNPIAGIMTKCDFCFDHIEQGLPPACVAACPMRVLDYGQSTDSETNELRLWEAPPETHPYPLSPSSHTQPQLAIKPHIAMSTTEEKFIANLEEIQPRTPSIWEEVPLVLFTLLMQMAVGGFWMMMWTFPSNRAVVPLLLIGLCLGAGMLASLAHLGKKKNAWRAITNLRRSWLSREVLFTGLFGTGWLFILLENVFRNHNTIEVLAITSALGLGLVYSMSQVYRLPAVPAWNTWRTNAGFLISTLLLGQSALALLSATGTTPPGPFSQWATAILLLVQLVLTYKQPSHPLHGLRAGLILAGVLLVAIGSLPTLGWVSLLVFGIVLLEEILGKWSFYQARYSPLSSLERKREIGRYGQ